MSTFPPYQKTDNLSKLLVRLTGLSQWSTFTGNKLLTFIIRTDLMSEYIKLLDVYASAYIIAKMSSSELLSHFRENGATTFIFRNSRELQKHLDDFFSLKGMIEPRIYSLAIKEIKTMIHNCRLAQNQHASTFSNRNLNNDFNNNRGDIL